MPSSLEKIEAVAAALEGGRTDNEYRIKRTLITDILATRLREALAELRARHCCDCGGYEGASLEPKGREET